METSLSTTRLKKTVTSEISNTASPETRQSVVVTTTNVTEMITKTTDINHVKTSPSFNKMSVISEASTTTTLYGTKSLIPVKITTITESTQITTDINDMKDLSTTQQSMTVISYVSTTASPSTKPLVPANMIKVTGMMYSTNISKEKFSRAYSHIYFGATYQVVTLNVSHDNIATSINRYHDLVVFYSVQYNTLPEFTSHDLQLLALMMHGLFSIRDI
ncbi:unnamed protein product [Mytilus coruscus]|uniref:Uncharacterized protein n=1 Tax=Mytilus coruscus TaxID=42192 RepID=A0A6J8BRY6_MYTCO|nr:unnamed protein product [Mytilus coruscus]